MSQLTIEDVEYIAELARLDLTDEEKQLYLSQLSAILDYAGRLQTVDTNDIPPTASVLPVDTVTRPDKSRPGLRDEELLGNTDHSEDGMFKVDVILGD